MSGTNLQLVNDTNTPGDKRTSDPRISASLPDGSGGYAGIEFDLYGDGSVDYSESSYSSGGTTTFDPRNYGLYGYQNVTIKARTYTMAGAEEGVTYSGWDTINFVFESDPNTAPALTNIRLQNDTATPADLRTSNPTIVATLTDSDNTSTYYGIEFDLYGDGSTDYFESYYSPGSTATFDPRNYGLYGYQNVTVKARALEYGVYGDITYGSWQTINYVFESDPNTAPSLTNLRLQADTRLPGDSRTSNPTVLATLTDPDSTSTYYGIEFDLYGDGSTDYFESYYSSGSAAAFDPRNYGLYGYQNVTIKARALEYGIYGDITYGAWQTISYVFESDDITPPYLTQFRLQSDTGYPGDSITTNPVVLATVGDDIADGSYYGVEFDLNADGYVDYVASDTTAYFDPRYYGLYGNSEVTIRARAVDWGIYGDAQYGSWQTITYTYSETEVEYGYSNSWSIHDLQLIYDDGTANDRVSTNPTITGVVDWFGVHLESVTVTASNGYSAVVNVPLASKRFTFNPYTLFPSLVGSTSPVTFAVTPNGIIRSGNIPINGTETVTIQITPVIATTTSSYTVQGRAGNEVVLPDFSLEYFEGASFDLNGETLTNIGVPSEASPYLNARYQRPNGVIISRWTSEDPNIRAYYEMDGVFLYDPDQDDVFESADGRWRFPSWNGRLIDVAAHSSLNQVQGTIDWGDGTSSTVSLTADRKSLGVYNPFRVAGNHTYQTPGTYTATLQLTGMPIYDGGGSVSLGSTVQRTITFQVQAPTVEDAYSVSHDRTLVTGGTGHPAGVLANDGLTGTVTARIHSGVSHGSLTFAANGTFTYVPTTGFVGQDSFEYIANDGTTDSAVTRVTITVSNAAPVANADSFTVRHDRLLTVNSASGLLANDQDADQDALTISVTGGPAHGQLTMGTGGAFTYQPQAGFTGTDSFQYRVSDGITTSGWVTVTLTIENAAPVAVSESSAVHHGGTATKSLLANDSDADGDSLTVQIQGTPQHGTLTANGGGSYTYHPAAGFVGQETIAYVVSDGVSTSAVAYWTITVTNTAPTAIDHSASLIHSRPQVINLLTGAADGDGDTLTVVIIDPPSHGTLVWVSGGQYRYTPTSGYVGDDQFRYAVSDGAETSEPADVLLTITNQAPVANPNTYSIPYTRPFTFDVRTNDTDADSDPLTVTIVTDVEHGTLVQNPNGTLTYTPELGFVGEVSFTYTVSDGAATTDPVTVTFQVSNLPPTATGESYSVVHDRTLLADGQSGRPAGLTANDQDGDQDPLTVEIVSGPAHGTLTLLAGGAFRFVPDEDYVGPDSFVYRVTDGYLWSEEVTATITVTNQAPTAVDDSFTTLHGRTLTGSLRANDQDLDGDPLAITLLGDVSHGTLAVNSATGAFIYTPDSSFVGTETFQYQLSDGVATTAPVTVTFTVTNQTPTATDDSKSVVHDRPVSINVLANDSDPDAGETLTVTIGTQPAHGTVEVLAGGVVRYTPNTGYVGSDSFTYRVSDGQAESSEATVSIAVTNAPPVAAPNLYTIGHDRTLTVSAAQGVLANDSDANGDPLTATSVSQPTNGVLTLQPNGAFTYTPNALWVGVDTFEYRVSDGAESRTATVTINVVNQAPIAGNDSATIYTNQFASIPILQNDADPDGDLLVPILASPPLHGYVAYQGTSLIYTPYTGFTGTEVLAYSVTDGIATSAPATVTISVQAARPVATDDQYTVNYNETIRVDPRVNDFDPTGARFTPDPVSSGTVNSSGETVITTAHGKATFHLDGTVTYDPDDDYRGNDELLYKAYNGTDYSETSARITFKVEKPVPSHMGPIVQFSTYRGVPTFLGYYSEQPTITAQPTHGTLTYSGSSLYYTSSVEYVPDITSDSFGISVQDGSDSYHSDVNVTFWNRTASVSFQSGTIHAVEGDDTPIKVAEFSLVSDTFDPDLMSATIKWNNTPLQNVTIEQIGYQQFAIYASVDAHKPTPALQGTLTGPTFTVPITFFSFYNVELIPPQIEITGGQHQIEVDENLEVTIGTVTLATSGGTAWLEVVAPPEITGTFSLRQTSNPKVYDIVFKSTSNLVLDNSNAYLYSYGIPSRFGVAQGRLRVVGTMIDSTEADFTFEIAGQASQRTYRSTNNGREYDIDVLDIIRGEELVVGIDVLSPDPNGASYRITWPDGQQESAAYGDGRIEFSRDFDNVIPLSQYHAYTSSRVADTGYMLCKVEVFNSNQPSSPQSEFYVQVHVDQDRVSTSPYISVPDTTETPPTLAAQPSPISVTFSEHPQGFGIVAQVAYPENAEAYVVTSTGRSLLTISAAGYVYGPTSFGEWSKINKIVVVDRFTGEAFSAYYYAAKYVAPAAAPAPGSIRVLPSSDQEDLPVEVLSAFTVATDYTFARIQHDLPVHVSGIHWIDAANEAVTNLHIEADPESDGVYRVVGDIGALPPGIYTIQFTYRIGDATKSFNVDVAVAGLSVPTLDPAMALGNYWGAIELPEGAPTNTSILYNPSVPNISTIKSGEKILIYGTDVIVEGRIQWRRAIDIGPWFDGRLAIPTQAPSITSPIAIYKTIQFTLDSLTEAYEEVQIDWGDGSTEVRHVNVARIISHQGEMYYEVGIAIDHKFRSPGDYIVTMTVRGQSQSRAIHASRMSTSAAVDKLNFDVMKDYVDIEVARISPGYQVAPESGTIEWGDGTSSEAIFRLNPDGSVSILGSHRYVSIVKEAGAVVLRDPDINWNEIFRLSLTSEIDFDRLHVVPLRRVDVIVDDFPGSYKKSTIDVTGEYQLLEGEDVDSVKEALRRFSIWYGEMAYDEHNRRILMELVPVESVAGVSKNDTRIGANGQYGDTIMVVPWVATLPAPAPEITKWTATYSGDQQKLVSRDSSAVISEIGAAIVSLASGHVSVDQGIDNESGLGLRYDSGLVDFRPVLQFQVSTKIAGDWPDEYVATLRVAGRSPITKTFAIPTSVRESDAKTLTLAIQLDTALLEAEYKNVAYEIEAISDSESFSILTGIWGIQIDAEDYEEDSTTSEDSGIDGEPYNAIPEFGAGWRLQGLEDLLRENARLTRNVVGADSREVEYANGTKDYWSRIDGVLRFSRRVYADGREMRLEYEDGRLTKIHLRTGLEITFVHEDEFVRRIEFSDGRKIELDIQDGVLKGISHLDGTEPVLEREFTYNESHKLTSDTLGSTKTTFVYDDPTGTVKEIVVGTGAEESRYTIVAQSRALVEASAEGAVDPTKIFGSLVVPQMKSTFQGNDPTTGQPQFETSEQNEAGRTIKLFINGEWATIDRPDSNGDEQREKESFKRSQTRYTEHIAVDGTRSFYQWNFTIPERPELRKVTSASDNSERTFNGVMLTKEKLFVGSQGPGDDGFTQRLFTWDNAGNLTKEEFEGLVRTWSSSPIGLLQSSTNELGLITNVQSYDSKDRPLQVVSINPSGGDNETRSMSFEYDDDARTTTVTDGLGNVTRYEYDILGRLISLQVTDANTDYGVVRDEQYSYYPDGSLKDVTRSGVTTHYEYNSRGQVTDVYETYETDVERWTRTEYNADGTVKRIRHFLNGVDNFDSTEFYYDSANGKTWTVRYNLAGSRTADPTFTSASKVAEVTETTVDQKGRVVSEYNRLTGLHVDYEYPDDQTVIKKTYSDVTVNGVTGRSGTYEEFHYSYGGDLLQEKRGVFTQSNQPQIELTTGYRYNALGYVEQTIAMGAAGDIVVTDFVTDAAGNVLRKSVRGGTSDAAKALPPVVAQYEYDAFGQLRIAYDGAGGTTRFEYDAVGNLASVTDSNNLTTTYQYDVLGRLREQTDPAGGVSRYQYDGAGNLVSQSIAADLASADQRVQRTTTYTYDALGRLRTTSQALDGISQLMETRDYPPSGRWDVIVTTPGPNGTTTTTSYDYDPDGKLAAVSKDGVLTVENLYLFENGTYKVLSGAVKEGSATPVLVGSAVYTALGWKLSESDSADAMTWRAMEFASTGDATKSVDRNGRVSETQYWTSLGAVRSTSLTVDSLVMADSTFQYDASGNQIRQTTTERGKTNTYDRTYDGLGRIKTESTLVEVFDTNNGNRETPQIATRTWTYDGLTTIFTDRTGRETRTTVNPQARTSTTYYGGSAVTTEIRFNILGQTVSTKEGDNVSRTVYDDLGRVSEQEDKFTALGKSSGTHVTNIHWDLFSTLQQVGLRSGEGYDNILETTYNRNADGQIRSLAQSVTAGSSGHWNGTVGKDKSVKFEYGQDGLLKKVERFESYGFAPNNVRAASEYTYDVDGQVATINHKRANADVIAHYAVQRAAGGNVTTVTSSFHWRPANVLTVYEDVRTTTVGLGFQVSVSGELKKTVNGTTTIEQTVSGDFGGLSLEPGTVLGLQGVVLEDETFKYTYDKEGRLTGKWAKTPTVETVRHGETPPDSTITVVDGREALGQGEVSSTNQWKINRDDYVLPTITGVAKGTYELWATWKESEDLAFANFSVKATPTGAPPSDPVLTQNVGRVDLSKPPATANNSVDWRLVGTFTVDEAGTVEIKLDRKNPDGTPDTTKMLAFDAVRIVSQVEKETYTLDERGRTTKIETKDYFGVSKTVDLGYDVLGRNVVTKTTRHWDKTFENPVVSPEYTGYAYQGGTLQFDLEFSDSASVTAGKITKSYLYGPSGILAYDDSTAEDTVWTFADASGRIATVGSVDSEGNWRLVSRSPGVDGDLGVLMGDLDAMHLRSASLLWTGGGNFKFNNESRQIDWGPEPSPFSGWDGNTVGRLAYFLGGDRLADASDLKLGLGTGAILGGIYFAGAAVLAKFGIGAAAGGASAAGAGTAGAGYLGTFGTALAYTSLGVNSARVIYSGGQDGKLDFGLDLFGVGALKFAAGATGIARAAWLTGDFGANAYQGYSGVVGAYGSFQNGSYISGSLQLISGLLGATSAAYGMGALQRTVSMRSKYGRMYEDGFINAFVSGHMSRKDLEQLKTLAYNSPDLMRKNDRLRIFLDEAQNGFSSRFHQIYFNSKNDLARGTLAEEIQHATDNVAGLFTNSRLKGSVPALRARYGNEFANVVWHENTFRRIADTIEHGQGSILNLIFDASEAERFRRAADVLREELLAIGIVI